MLRLDYHWLCGRGGLRVQVIRPFCSDIVLDVIGAVVGGFLTSLFSIDTASGGGLTQVWIMLIMATAGAVVLILIGQLLTGRRR